MPRRGESRESSALPPEGRAAVWIRYGRYGAAAFEFTGTIGGAVAVGYLLDRAFGTPPWLLLALTLLGVAGGGVRLIQTLRHFDRTRNRAGG